MPGSALLRFSIALFRLARSVAGATRRNHRVLCVDSLFRKERTHRRDIVHNVAYRGGRTHARLAEGSLMTRRVSAMWDRPLRVESRESMRDR
jgi:hypothetical protein